jgi:hypothetical protein
MALISKGIKLYADNSTAQFPELYVEGLGTELIGLQEVGEIAGIGAGSNRDQIEVTTLADDKHMYVDGIQSESDASAITFKFLFNDELFTLLKSISQNETAVRGGSYNGELTTYSILIPAGIEKTHKFVFKGYISDLKLDSASVNSALTMSLSLTPAEEIKFTAAV